jgi:hypothetical protein
MTYKEWILLTKQEENGIAIDYKDPEGHSYSVPFCFHNIEEALNYGKLCIDQLIRSKTLVNEGAEAV